MQPDLPQIILAFLAARYPGSYTAETIALRIGASGLLDTPAIPLQQDVEREQLTLFNNGLVDRALEPAGTRLFWNATQKGLHVWHSAGRPYIGR